MATRILDFEFDELPPSITGLDGYESALVVIRCRGVPIGKIALSVAAGGIWARELREVVVEAFGAVIAERIALAEFCSAAAAHNVVGLRATIAVSTHERPDDLERCLGSITSLPEDGQECIVVDNNPVSGRTYDVVARFPSVRYIRELRPGVSAARNRALREAGGDVVVFCDDDTIPDAKWLRAVLEPFRDPLVQCVTGLTLPLELETKAQEIFEAKYGFSRRGFRRRSFQSPPNSPLRVGAAGASANMAVRRSVVEQIGWFDEALGPGTPTQSGEDHEFISRILRKGFRVYYHPSALNWHRHRRSWGELRKVVQGYGNGICAMWTRTLVFEGDWRVIVFAYRWFRLEQAPRILRSLFRWDLEDLELRCAELLGFASGPLAYLGSRWRLRRNTHE